ncbi:uncharacterized protein TNCV_4139091 [Trichonephila clavipes]|nr:uncharacterized protein TNCV_4139091 [Trichonephila clavipes]
MGHSSSKVVMEFGFSSKTISREYHEYKVSDQISSLKQWCGQKTTTKRDHRQLKRTVTRGRHLTFPQTAAYLNAGPSASVNVGTVQRTLIDMDFHRRKPSRVPLLNQWHKALPLAWANQHHRWTLNDWKSFIWSDESRFQLH